MRDSIVGITEQARLRSSNSERTYSPLIASASSVQKKRPAARNAARRSFSRPSAPPGIRSRLARLKHNHADNSQSINTHR
jgi:hypothetical protein